MIAIINTGGDMEGVCTYNLQINNDLITTFTHDRKHGLAKCLMLASEAADKASCDKTIEMIIKIEQWKSDKNYGK